MGIIAGSIDVVGSDVKQVTLDCINVCRRKRRATR